MIIMHKIKRNYKLVKCSFKENQLVAQFIFSIFCQTNQHVSGVSIAHHQEVHRMDDNSFLDDCLLSWLG